jgi:3-isopropylmalate dehydrogenase
MKAKKIAVLPGDGIGPEVMEEAIKILKAIEKKHKLNFEFSFADVGGYAYDKYKTALPKHTLELCEKSDAILFGSVGGPKWSGLSPDVSIERVALLGLRKHFNLFANFRPAVCYKVLADKSPLKNEIVGNGFDILIVRELTGDCYFGEKELTCEHGYDVMKYTEKEVSRIAKAAFESATKRKKHLTCVDKANVLSSSVFFRSHVWEMSKKYPDVALDYMYIDNATMQIIKRPGDFDVIVTTNMFGDILSDEAAMITGSIGMMPSASLNEKKFGLYEPAGGSAPDIAGREQANPIAQILSAAMMLKYSFDLENEAKMIESAVVKTLEEGYRTKDIMEAGKKELNTTQMGDMIVKNIDRT